METLRDLFGFFGQRNPRWGYIQDELMREQLKSGKVLEATGPPWGERGFRKNPRKFGDKDWFDMFLSGGYIYNYITIYW